MNGLNIGAGLGRGVVGAGGGSRVGAWPVRVLAGSARGRVGAGRGGGHWGGLDEAAEAAFGACGGGLRGAAAAGFGEQRRPPSGSSGGSGLQGSRGGGGHRPCKVWERAAVVGFGNEPQVLFFFFFH